MYSYYFMEIGVLGLIIMSAVIMPIIVASNKKHSDNLNDISKNLNNRGGMDMNGFMQMFGMLHSMGFFNQNNSQNPNGNNMSNMNMNMPNMNNMNQNMNNMSPYMLNNNKPKKTMTPLFAIAGIVFGLLVVVALI